MLSRSSWQLVAETTLIETLQLNQRWIERIALFVVDALVTDEGVPPSSICLVEEKQRPLQRLTGRRLLIFLYVTKQTYSISEMPI